jgi:general secretion pathway protein J
VSPARSPDAGVTLIEMMIALALFALIGTAGFAMLDQVLRSQRGSEGRLERLSEQERALHLIAADFGVAAPRSLSVTEDTVSLTRAGSGGSLKLAYRLDAGTLHRAVQHPGRAADQTLLTGVTAITWRFLTPEGEWSDTWPTDTVQSLTTPRNPRAVELTIDLQDNVGQLRRVAPLPADLE